MNELASAKREEKKVEYLELIYDLIFVYIIGRNNSLLHAITDGFVDPATFATYILSTLIILQIWYFTTLYINRYGDNGLRVHLCIFINMYLLYYMGDSTRVNWQGYFYRYNGAWALILINLAVQYLLRLKNSKGLMPWEDAHIRYNMRLLFAQATIVLLAMPLYAVTKIAFSPLAMVFGIVTVLMTQNKATLMTVDFPHLSERVMLYVVFTFGEMIVAIAGYFEGGVTLNNVYYSLMAFLIVVGLFQTYGYAYDHLIDREMKTNGIGYMTIHIFLITALNNITAALEFMREPEVRDVPKNIFLVCSIIAYFLFLFLTERYAHVRAGNNKRIYGRLLWLSAIFAVLMALFFRNAAVSIALSVLFIYAVYFSVYFYGRRHLASK